MGHFGGHHRDTHDCPFLFTGLTAASDLLPHWSPGRLHLLARFYVVLTFLVQLYFCGQHWHGGTPPIVPDGEDIPDWACRMVIMAYPPKGFVLGNISHSFAALLFSKDPFCLTPEMTGGPHVPSAVWSSRANIAHDGNVVMDNEALFRFIARGFLQVGFEFFQQLPHELGIAVDAQQLLSSITMQTADGTVSAGDWAEAPDSDVHNRFNASHQAIRTATLKTLYNHYLRGIPEYRPSICLTIQHLYQCLELDVQQMSHT